MPLLHRHSTATRRPHRRGEFTHCPGSVHCPLITFICFEHLIPIPVPHTCCLYILSHPYFCFLPLALAASTITSRSYSCFLPLILAASTVTSRLYSCFLPHTFAASTVTSRPYSDFLSLQLRHTPTLAPDLCCLYNYVSLLAPDLCCLYSYVSPIL